MDITLRSGKELKINKEAKKKHIEAETKKANQNSLGSKNKKSINGLLDEA